ncbi:MAG: 50S ribosomal protein L31e [Thaumarchaeota archaeon]|nr:50S ribosomal protein L31e [Nitrososphaerota archaeon]
MVGLGAEERTYTIPLGRVVLAPRYKRAERAVRIIREFVARHLRVEPGSVRLDPALNEILWSRGMGAGGLRRIRVKVTKEEATYRVSPS